MRQEIGDPCRWRISMSGFSIKTGAGDDTRIVCAYHAPTERPFDPARYQQWLSDAERICELHNAALSSREEPKA